MYFVPLSQLDSVELLVHSLKAAGGEADCTMCPAHKVCMKQCLTIAKAVEQMLVDGSLPQIGGDPPPEPLKSVEPKTEPDPDKPNGGGSGGKSNHLKIVK
ncbi:hypothetical protein SAMN02745165_02906 [Malonomonas rubra DSM 5091]|uniref:Radical SAM additional 4Fe4S-binding SPASM domain-containing protein n=1 Tax=Malonomonas rubra DSM 5091 TaxID=1122189 RepID=A0A1M6L7S0_MALRU|nr:hypothetical protein [Malonomonas rubra]SHJ67271.1 hypothetical protein SAMN02745165_02906 [Malonomonas rubra DSM 5091]